MLEDAGLENFPQLFAEAIVSGSLHLDSLYATKLSDSAMNINRPKAEGFRYSYVYKLVCALASSRPRCGAALVHVFRHPWASYPHAHTRAPRGSGISALDTVRGDVQDRSHLGDLLPSQTTLNNVFLVLAVDSEAGAFQGRNLQAFVELLAVESQAAGEAAADEAEAALATLQQGATEQVELWKCAAIAMKKASEASRAAGVASSMATAEQLRLQTAAAEQAVAVAPTGTAEPLLEERASKRQSWMLKELVAAPAALAARQATCRAELAAKRAEAAHGAMGAVVAREVAGVLEELLVRVESAAVAAATEPHPTTANANAVRVESAAAAAAAVAVATEPYPTAADAAGYLETDAEADADADANCAGPAVSTTAASAAAAAAAAAALPAAGELQMAATVAAKEVSPQLPEEHAEDEWAIPVPCFLRADATDIREEKFIHPKTLDWSGDVDLSAIDSINPKELHAKYKELHRGLDKYIEGDEEVARAEVAEQLRPGAKGEAALVDVLAFFAEHYDRVCQEVVELAAEYERKSVFYTRRNVRVAAKAAAAAAAAANGGGDGDGSAPPAKKQRVAAAPQFLGLSDIGNVTEINLKTARLLVTREIEVTFPDSAQPDVLYIGVVKHVHTPEEAGTDDTVWLLAKFEDGDEVSLEASDILQNLVPFSKMAPREEKFLKVSNAALAAELVARGKPYSGTKQALAERLAATLALEDDGSDPPPRPVPGPDSDEPTEAEGGAPAPTEEESGAAAASPQGGTGAQEGAQQEGFEDEDEDAVAALVDRAVAEQQTLFNTGQRKQLAKQQAKLIDKQQLLANMQQVLLQLCLLPLCLLLTTTLLTYYGSAYCGSVYYGSTYQFKNAETILTMVLLTITGARQGHRAGLRAQARDRADRRRSSRRRSSRRLQRGRPRGGYLQRRCPRGGR